MRIGFTEDAFIRASHLHTDWKAENRNKLLCKTFDEMEILVVVFVNCVIRFNAYSADTFHNILCKCRQTRTKVLVCRSEVLRAIRDVRTFPTSKQASKYLQCCRIPERCQQFLQFWMELSPTLSSLHTKSTRDVSESQWRFIGNCQNHHSRNFVPGSFW